MKKLRYLYTLITVVLLSTVIYSCDDSSIFISEDGDTNEIFSDGETIKTTFTVGISAPNVSGDVDVETRAGGDNANIEYAKPENGGRFQNIVVVLTDDASRIWGIKCDKWYTTEPNSVGVKDYEAIFSDVEMSSSEVGKTFKVYVFGNVCMETYNRIESKMSSIISNININKGRDIDKRYKITDSDLFINSECITPNISVDNVYNISFKPGEKYKLSTVADFVSSTGMPVNNSVTATVVKGNTQFNVALKRVCARLQVTFRNFTGTYKDYDNSGIEKPNNVYVDSFVIKKALATSTNYFYNGTAPSEGTADFNFKKALGVTKDNDHIINKIENGKDLVVSMYVFETKKTSGNYTYDLKVDRGKSLGLNTTKIDTANAYVIWNNQKQRSIAYDGSKIYATPQENSDVIPFDKQVFWKLVTPNVSRKTPVEGAYAIKNYPIDKDDKSKTATDAYFVRLTEGNRDLDWGFLHGGYEYKHVEKSASSTLSGAQYIQFVLNKSSQNEYSLNLLQGDNVDKPYWNHSWGNDDYAMLSICQTSTKPSTSADKHNCDNSTPSGGHLSTIVDWSSTALNNYEWTLYAKYIIRKNEAVNFNKGDVTGPISKIDRNHSYELDFSVMPNYDTKQELLVNCVRKQSEISWSETQK